MSDNTGTSQGQSLLAKKSASLLDQAKAKAQSFGTDLAKSAVGAASQAVSGASDELKAEAVNNLLTKAVTFADSNQVAKQASSALSGLADGQVPNVDQVKAQISSVAEGALKGSAGSDTSKSAQPTGGVTGQDSSGSQAHNAASVTTTSESDKPKTSERAGAKDKQGKKGDAAHSTQLSSTAQPFSEVSDSFSPLPGTTAAITYAVTQMLADDHKQDETDPILEFFTSNNH